MANGAGDYSRQQSTANTNCDALNCSNMQGPAQLVAQVQPSE